MGRRSRKRSLAGVGAPRRGRGETAGQVHGTSRAERDAERRRRAIEESGAKGGRRRGSRRGTQERPQAPWGRFPLSELVVLLGIVLAVAGFVMQSREGTIMLLAGLALGSLAGLELAYREHFAGYRSHSSLLAACVSFGAGAVVVLALPGRVPVAPVAVVAVVVFAVAFYLFREAFKRRSGGLGFR
jgi:hypothetical protein